MKLKLKDLPVGTRMTACLGVPDGWILIPQDMLSSPESEVKPRFMRVAHKINNHVTWFYKESDHVAYMAEIAMNDSPFVEFESAGEELRDSLLMLDSKGASILVHLNDGKSRYILPIPEMVC